MRRTHPALAALIMLLLSACTEAPIASQAWQGTGQTSTSSYTVELEYEMYGTSLVGHYYFDGASRPDGKAEGEIENGVVEMVLSPNLNQSWNFAGTVTDTRLQGTFVPRVGVYSTGEWDLYRK